MADKKKLVVLHVQDVHVSAPPGEKLPASVWGLPDYGEADDGPAFWEDPQAVQLTEFMDCDAALKIAGAVAMLLQSLGHDTELAEGAND